MPKPHAVKEAQYNGDSKALSALGRAGALETNRRKHAKRVEDDMCDAARAEEHFERREESNENEYPIDA